MTTTKVTCDVCGTEKKETNHWYVIHFSNDSQIVTISCFKADKDFQYFDVCGKPCAFKLISERLK
jgi:hypothetical protein